jgi:hypothetical protein
MNLVLFKLSPNTSLKIITIKSHSFKDLEKNMEEF